MQIASTKVNEFEENMAVDDGSVFTVCMMGEMSRGK